MTHRELDLLADLTSKPLGGGCSDYFLRNTDENWAIVEEALAANAFQTVDEYRADVDDFFHQSRPDTGDIHTQDYLLRHHLLAKIRREMVEAIK